EKQKALWLYNLRDLNTDFIHRLSYEPERNGTLLEMLIADRFASDELSQEIISKAFPMKLFLEMQEFGRGNDYNYLVEMLLDMNRFKGADAVEDCFRIDDKFIHQKFVQRCLESLKIGFCSADDARA